MRDSHWYVVFWFSNTMKLTIMMSVSERERKRGDVLWLVTPPTELQHARTACTCKDPPGALHMAPNHGIYLSVNFKGSQASDLNRTGLCSGLRTGCSSAEVPRRPHADIMSLTCIC